MTRRTSMRWILPGIVLGLGALGPLRAASADPVPFPRSPEAGAASFGNGSFRVKAVLVHGDTIYVAGRFTVSQGGVSRSNLAALDLDGNLKTAFAPSLNGPVWALATDGASLFVGGEFTRLGLNTRLAAVDLVTGRERREFLAHVDGALDPEERSGVHALAVLTDESTEPPTVRLLVGGNFTQVNSLHSALDNRLGLAALDPITGELDSTRFAQGVEGGYVRALLASGTTVYVGGTFTTIQGQSASLAALDGNGARLSGSFASGGYPILSLDIDAANNRLFAAVGGQGFSANRVRAYTASGGSRGQSAWQGPRVDGQTMSVGGDVQSVHFYGGNVYFGFHDGLFAQPDSSKVAAVDADTGALEVDTDHAGLTCGSAPEVSVNCWLPALDSTEGGQGFFGVWAIGHYVDPITSKGRLLLGGDFTQIGGVTRTRRFAILREP